MEEGAAALVVVRPDLGGRPVGSPDPVRALGIGRRDAPPSSDKRVTGRRERAAVSRPEAALVSPWGGWVLRVGTPGMQPKAFLPRLVCSVGGERSVPLPCSLAPRLAK